MLFEVTRSPEGTSPKWVRDAWVGVQFQALQAEPMLMPTLAASTKSSVSARVLGAKSAQPKATERLGYLTNARDVLGLLALVNADAAKWYIENTPQMLNPEQVFLFDLSHCVAIRNLS